MSRQRTCFRGFVLLLILLVAPALGSAGSGEQRTGNRAQRLEWFEELGFGLFVHWSLDSQLGSVISHSLVGASEDYMDRYFRFLPQNFCPSNFEPEQWARLARIAGVKYVVFTAKHHSGFCMFETATHDFDIVSTPYGKDVLREVVDAFRRTGIAIGLYFSPDDFYFLHRQGILISRRRAEAQPENNSRLMAHNKAQVNELLSHYGPIDVMFFDGPAQGLTELAWQLQPDIVITRGALKTPEIAPSTPQRLPAQTIWETWEACFTMGTSWQFKPTNEKYSSGTELIELLIETRAKGGNMLLNIGPDPDGEIPFEQQNRLREVGLWNFVNGEAIYGVKPWVVSNEGDIWFTQKKGHDTVYAIETGEPWPWGCQRTLTLKTVRATERTEISVLGQNDEVLEYRLEVTPRTTWRQDEQGLHVTATRAQRLYNDRTWPNPVVLKITHCESVGPSKPQVRVKMDCREF